MTTPAAPAVALPVLYHKSSAEGADGRLWPAIVTGVIDTGAAEFVDLTVFPPGGGSVARARVISQNLWASAGSDPTVAFWSYAELNPS
jgi:hypothetical protein